jgi:hypothetical protein
MINSSMPLIGGSADAVIVNGPGTVIANFASETGGGGRMPPT